MSARKLAPDIATSPAKKKKIAEPILVWAFRFLTLLSASYLVYDRVYETKANINSTGSDPLNPFFFPFAVTNNSHIFSLKYVTWKCFLDNIEYQDEIKITGSAEVNRGQSDVIFPGGTLNIYCGGGFKIDKQLRKASIRIEANYFADFCGALIKTSSPPIRFSWAASPTANRQQWIRGDF